MGRAETTAFPRLPLNSFRLPVDVLVVWRNPAAFAAKHATTTIPILIGAAGDVVNTGLLSNLARPDPNLTGFIALNVDLEGKRVELLKEAMPRLSRIAVLTNPGNPISRLNVDIARQAAEKLGVKIEVVEAKNAAQVDGALAQITQLHPDAALIASDTQLLSKRKEIAHGQ
jgi:putative ABC transport system substrate-binding protein